MSILPPELCLQIARDARPHRRFVLAQVSHQFNDMCMELIIDSLKMAIISGDIFSIVHMARQQVHFLSNDYVRAAAIALCAAYPCARIFRYFCMVHFVTIPIVVADAIFLRRRESRQHEKMAQCCAMIAVGNHRSGARHIMALHNNTCDVVPCDITNFHILIAAANNCMVTVEYVIRHNIELLYEKFADVVLLCAFYSHGRLLWRLLEYARLTFNWSTFRNNIITRAYLIVMSHWHDDLTNDHDINKLAKSRAIIELAWEARGGPPQKYSRRKINEFVFGAPVIPIAELMDHIIFSDARYYGDEIMRMATTPNQTILSHAYKNRSIIAILRQIMDYMNDIANGDDAAFITAIYNVEARPHRQITIAFEATSMDATAHQMFIRSLVIQTCFLNFIMPLRDLLAYASVVHGVINSFTADDVVQLLQYALHNYDEETLELIRTHFPIVHVSRKVFDQYKKAHRFFRKERLNGRPRQTIK